MSGVVLTNQALTKERNGFLRTLLIIVGCAILLGVIEAAAPGDWSGLNGFFSLASTVTLIYRIARISRFLNTPIWLTVLYCVLAFIPILFLVPLIGLTSSFGKARKIAEKAERGLLPIPTR